MTTAHIELEAALSNTQTLRPDSPRVMIVEDEAIVAEDLSDQLSDMGYTVCGIADNCEEAMSLAEKHRPHVIMMDIVIKGNVDGIGTAEKIARRFHIPIIFATAYSDPATVARAARAAPYGYITKPYQARDVRAAIEVALYKSTLEHRLKESEQWFSATLRCVADGVLATDMQGNIQFVNPAAEALLGKSLNNLVGRSAIAELGFLNNKSSIHPLHQLLQKSTGRAQINFGLTLLTQQNASIQVDFSAALIRNEHDEAIGAVVALRDISERLVAEEALKASEERFRTAFEFAPIGMALISMEGRVIQHNNALLDLLNCHDENLEGLSQRDLTVPDDWNMEEAELHNLLIGDIPCVQFEKRMRFGDKNPVCVHASASLLRKNDIPICYLYQLHDITERKQYEAHILRMAHYDALTGLANRARLAEEIDRQIATSRRTSQSFAVLFCDLDHFKNVNDTLGHEAGDHLLQVVARRLNTSVRESDMVARLGGDEFVILLTNINAPEYAARVAHKLKAQITRPVEIGAEEARVGGSFGISLYPTDGEDARTLLRNADSALYESKNQGRNGVQFYRDELTRKVEEQLHITTELRNALERNEFALYFQPIVNLQDGKIRALEALLRWNHPTLGTRLPDSFLPAIDESGLAVVLGCWVIQEACRARAAWQKFESTPIAVSINVSSSQFAGNQLVPTLQAALNTYGVNPADVIIELTEQIMLEDSEHNMQIINQLLNLGVSLALDDFGKGYSSLSYIVRFTPSKLKIDRSFIGAIGENKVNDAMVESILALGSRLPITAIAEGIETQAQAEFVKQRGCTLGQGFLFSKPLPESELTTFLKAQ